MPEPAPEPTEFPVDVWPLIRAGILLFLAFAALCIVAYSGSEMYGAGVGLLALIVCFSAYTLRSDTFRMAAILLGGLFLCLILYIFGGSGGDTPADQETTPKQIPSDVPEGLGQ